MLLTTADLDKPVVLSISKMSKNTADKAPKSSLKDKCLAAFEASKTKEERRATVCFYVIL